MRLRLICFSFLLFISATVSSGQNYYVVVGAFAQESNAQKFTGYVKSLRFSAEYKLNKAKNFFYVYVMVTGNRNEGLAQVGQLKEESEFKDTWLFTGLLEGDHALVAEPVEEIKQTEVIVAEEAAPPDTLAATPGENPLDPPQVADASEMKVKGKLFRFVIETTDGKPLQGEVHNVDFRRGREIATYKSGTYVDLVHSSNRSEPMSIVCGIFGYKEVVKFLDYANPVSEEGVTKDEKGAWVVQYKLERLAKGDVSVMYHVAFYKDAVVMLPVSKGEMDELVNMMKDNPDYRIKIHGHCNGNNSRRIIALGPTKNYFNVAGSDERNGSAKELTRLRAEAVQDYLADNGIDKGRSEIYAWGALNMLVPQTSSSAKLNDRIEIEIRKD